MVQPSRKVATFEDLVAYGDAARLEIVGGEIIGKAAPSADHSWAETRLVETMGPFNHKPGGRGPGGWWIFTEVHVTYPHGEVYCHEVAGGRRERVPERPTGWPVRSRPDWVCEIVSPKHEKQDLVVKPRVLHAAEVPHYWVVDPEEQILLVHRWSPAGYTVVQRAAADEVVRAEPFEAIELRVAVLFGQDDLE